MAARHLAKWFINREMLFNMRISVVQNKTVPPSDGAQLVDEEQEENSKNKERILLSPAALPQAAPWRRIIPESTSLRRLAVGQFNRRPHETGNMKVKWNDKKKPKTSWNDESRCENICLVLVFPFLHSCCKWHLQRRGSTCDMNTAEVQRRHKLHLCHGGDEKRRLLGFQSESCWFPLAPVKPSASSSLLHPR